MKATKLSSENWNAALLTNARVSQAGADREQGGSPTPHEEIRASSDLPGRASAGLPLVGPTSPCRGAVIDEEKRHLCAFQNNTGETDSWRFPRNCTVTQAFIRT